MIIALLLPCWVAAAARSVHAGGGATLETWRNAVMAGPAATTTAGQPMSGVFNFGGAGAGAGAGFGVASSGDDGVISAVWVASLTPNVSGAYEFNCSFANGFGLAWVDGHVLCTESMPLYTG